MTFAGMREALDSLATPGETEPFTQEQLTDLLRNSITDAYAHSLYPVVCSESEARLIHWINAPEFIEVDGVKYQKYRTPPPPKPKKRRKRRTKETTAWQ